MFSASTQIVFPFSLKEYFSLGVQNHKKVNIISLIATYNEFSCIWIKICGWGPVAGKNSVICCNLTVKISGHSIYRWNKLWQLVGGTSAMWCKDGDPKLVRSIIVSNIYQWKGWVNDACGPVTTGASRTSPSHLVSLPKTGHGQWAQVKYHLSVLTISALFLYFFGGRGEGLWTTQISSVTQAGVIQ